MKKRKSRKKPIEELRAKYIHPALTGRPPEYNNAEEMQERIEEYFKTGHKKKKKVDSFGKEHEVGYLTITGLALYLGFDSRQSFYDYEKKPLFAYTVKRAKALLEAEYEERLGEPNAGGAIFALKNFGWKDNKSVEVSNGNRPLEIQVGTNKEASLLNDAIKAAEVSG